MGNKYGEPLWIEHVPHDGMFYLRNTPFGDTVKGFIIGRIMTKDIAIRIVACINACAGIENPEQFINDARSYSQLNDLLLELEQVVRDKDAEIARLKDILKKTLSDINLLHMINRTLINWLKIEIDKKETDDA